MQIIVLSFNTTHMFLPTAILFDCNITVLTVLHLYYNNNFHNKNNIEHILMWSVNLYTSY